MTGANEIRDPETILAAWLDDGPTDLPDVTRRAILTALPTTPQASRGLLARWRFPHMSMFARGASVLVVAIVAIGGLALVTGSLNGGGGTGPSPVPSAPSSPPASPSAGPSAGPSAPASPSAGPSFRPPGTPPPLPALNATFISPTHGFQVKYPAGWTVTPGVGPWFLGTNREPGNPVSDAIVTPSGTYRMRLSGASIALPSGMTMDQFRSFASPYSSPFDPNPCPPLAPLPVPLKINAQATAGASPKPVEAVVSINGCAALADLGGSIYDIEVIAGGRGYTFTLDGQLTTADALAWLATIELQPARATSGSGLPSPSPSN